MLPSHKYYGYVWCYGYLTSTLEGLAKEYPDLAGRIDKVLSSCERHLSEAEAKDEESASED